MLAFARETRLSETTFVQAASDGAADYRNRIWTVEGEIPFAGHPSLGTAVAMARAAGAGGLVRFVQQTGAGCQPVEVEPRGERAWRASMLQEPPALGAEVEPAEALAAIGLEPGEAADGLPPQFVSTGIPHLMVPLARPEALARVRPDHEAIARVLAPGGGIVLYAAAADLTAGIARARGLTGTAAMGEDPATGSAAGPLCAYLAARAGLSAVEIVQGVDMGRPSRLHAAVEGDRVRVGGDVVLVAEGTVWLPDVVNDG
jgi:trans-2,3-dihydro-3-hydroxyanthranilate isomerase